MRVHLREKDISNGRVSLYLDFYPPIVHPSTGKPTRREFLNLHLVKNPRGIPEREQNKETLMLAENIRAQRQIAIQNESYGFIDKSKKNLDFVQYFRDLAEKKNSSQGNQINWLSSFNYLKAFVNGVLPMSSIDEKFCVDFRDHLMTTLLLKKRKGESKRLSQNAAHSYFNKFKAAVGQAYRDRLIQINIADRIDGIKQEETQREFLTKEELDLLVKTECDPPLLKTASLFAVLTGLRWSDVMALTWAQVHYTETEGYFIRFKQKKTKGAETHPISETAFNLLGERNEDKERPFNGLVYSAWLNMKLKLWIRDAGIRKNITFHCFRHTYATLQLSNGTDIFTVSKLLGHKNLKTTQIYAKIVDERKRESVDKIKIDL